MKTYLYKTINTVNNKYYIGVHTCRCKAECKYLGSGIALKAAIVKYGREKFEKIILESSNNEEYIYELEKSLVNPKDNMSYNLTLGGRGSNRDLQLGKKVSEKTRKLQSLANTGKGLDKARKSSLKTNSKGVIINGKFYNSHSEAARILKIPRTTVTSRVRGKNPSYIATDTLTVSNLA